jgi:predicted small integral membrane protein
MMLRVCKLLLVLALALFYSFVVLNNTNDYNSNYLFIRHVLMNGKPPISEWPASRAS